MSERQEPEIEVIHPEVEVLPLDHFEPDSPRLGTRTLIAVRSSRGRQRIYMATPGPFTSAFLAVVFGIVLTLTFIAALGLFVFLIGASAVVLSGFLIYGLIHAALRRLH
jgi:hypothetical protein